MRKERLPNSILLFSASPVARGRYAAPSMEEGENFRQANLPRRMPDGTQRTGHRLARPGEKVGPLAVQAARSRSTLAATSVSVVPLWARLKGRWRCYHVRHRRSSRLCPEWCAEDERWRVSCLAPQLHGSNGVLDRALHGCPTLSSFSRFGWKLWRFVCSVYTMCKEPLGVRRSARFLRLCACHIF